MKKYKIEKNIYDYDKECTHLIFMYSETKRGCNIQKVFAGSRKECMEFINDKKEKH